MMSSIRKLFFIFGIFILTISVFGNFEDAILNISLFFVSVITMILSLREDIKGTLSIIAPIATIFGFMFLFISIQASWPIITPKIEIDYDIIRGTYNLTSGEQYAGQYATITVYPPLFPGLFSSNYNNYEVAHKIKHLEELESNPLIKISKSSEREIGIEISASGWKWNKISEKIYIDSDKKLNNVYIYGENISSFIELKNLEKNSPYSYDYIYNELRLMNRENFPVDFVDINLEVLNGSEAWNKLTDWIINGRGYVRVFYSDTWDYTKSMTRVDIIYGGRKYTEINSSAFKFPKLYISFDQRVEANNERNPVLIFKRYAYAANIPRIPYPVGGIVTYRNQPIKSATVILRNIQTNEEISYTTASDGSYFFDLANLPTAVENGDSIEILGCFRTECSAVIFKIDMTSGYSEINIDI